MREWIDMAAVEAACANFRGAEPFDHAIIDNFLAPDVAEALEADMPAYDSEVWYEYHNAVEYKRTCNRWNVFPATTYAFFSYLNSPEMVAKLSRILGIAPLYADHGLHGGGWHIHATGGKLNPHLDYSIHPKVGLQRKLNLIIYLNRDWPIEWGGGLGLWRAGPDGPGEMVKELAPAFNRALLFDTTQNSWHGLSRALSCPPDRYRKSLAAYYLTDPPAGVDPRGKALYSPTEDQKGDPAVLELIRLRADTRTAAKVWHD